MTQLNISHPITREEWASYHKIMKSQIFDPIKMNYNPRHHTFTDKNHFHFILLNHENIVVSVAHIEIINTNNTNQGVCRTMATDPVHQRQGYAGYLLNALEQWLKMRDINAIYLHAAPHIEDYYKKRGYTPIAWQDPHIKSLYMGLGKDL